MTGYAIPNFIQLRRDARAALGLLIVVGSSPQAVAEAAVKPMRLNHGLVSDSLPA